MTKLVLLWLMLPGLFSLDLPEDEIDDKRVFTFPPPLPTEKVPLDVRYAFTNRTEYSEYLIDREKYPHCPIFCRQAWNNGQCDERCNTAECVKDMGNCEDRTRMILASQCDFERKKVCTGECVIAGSCNDDKYNRQKKPVNIRQILLLHSKEGNSKTLMKVITKYEDAFRIDIGLEAFMIANETHPGSFGYITSENLPTHSYFNSETHVLLTALHPIKTVGKGFDALFELTTDLAIAYNNVTLIEDINTIFNVTTQILYFEQDSLPMTIEGMAARRQAEYERRAAKAKATTTAKPFDPY